MTEIKQRVVVVGASDRQERHSNQAVRLLVEHGHDVLPVNPKVKTIGELKVLRDLDQVEGPVDTLTVYVSARVSSSMQGTILRLRPGRVIFNPGAENPELQKLLSENGIKTEEACTLVLLRTGQF